MNRIIWLKWKDPLNPLVKGFEPEEDEHDPDFADARKSFGDDDGEYDQSRVEASKKSGFGPGVVSPMGIVPLRESNIPSTLFNFWMGHTNFDITPQVRDAIALVQGVESLDVFTRYRFRLSVGRAFDQAEVKKAVELSVSPTPQPTSPAQAKPVEEAKPEDKLATIKKLLSKTHAFWAIFVMPSGLLQFVGGESESVVMAKAKEFQGLAEQTILSWENESA